MVWFLFVFYSFFMISHAMSWEGRLEKSLVQKGRRERKKFGNRWAMALL